MCPTPLSCIHSTRTSPDRHILSLEILERRRSDENQGYLYIFLRSSGPFAWLSPITWLQVPSTCTDVQASAGIESAAAETEVDARSMKEWIEIRDELMIASQ